MTKTICIRWIVVVADSAGNIEAIVLGNGQVSSVESHAQPRLFGNETDARAEAARYNAVCQSLRGQFQVRELRMTIDAPIL